LTVNCRRVRSLLSAYIDYELTGHEMLALRDHLSHCRECRDEHYSLKTMKYLLSALPEKEPNPEWVVYLAESISRPTPTLTQRLRTQWERSWDAASSLLAPRGARENILLPNRRLVSALMLSAVAIFAVTVSFDRPAALQPVGSAMVRDAAQPANLMPFGSSRSVDPTITQRSLPSGTFELIPIPVAPSPLTTGPANLLPANDVIRPVQPSYRESYLKNLNMHVIPPPGGMSSFGAPLPMSRLAEPLGGH